MLHDLEAGRVMETDALLGSVLELARLTQTEVPSLEAVYALTKLLGKAIEANDQGGGSTGRGSAQSR
jgi:2-dehydropantoate 2-reductase